MLSFKKKTQPCSSFVSKDTWKVWQMFNCEKVKIEATTYSTPIIYCCYIPDFLIIGVIEMEYWRKIL